VPPAEGGSGLNRRQQRGAEEAVTKPFRPYGTRINFSTLPGTSRSASCRATVVPCLRHWIWWLLFHRRTVTLSFVPPFEAPHYHFNPRATATLRLL